MPHIIPIRLRTSALACLSFLAVAGAVIACDVTHADDLEIHVSTSGKTVARGSNTDPMGSIAAAQRLARAAVAENATRNVTVKIAPGTYPLDAPLQFTQVDTREGTVTYQAAGGEVVISGGKTITGWKKQGRFLVAEIPAVKRGDWYFRELFVANRRAVRAREPDDGFLRVAKVGADRRTNFEFASADAAVLKGALPDGELKFLHDWSTSQVPIQSIDFDENRVYFCYPVGPAARHYAMDHFEKQPRYFLTGAKAFLDEPGEWWLDRSAGQIHYLPRSGETAENLQVVAPQLEALVTVSGTTGTPVRELQFRGLTFSHCLFPLPKEGYAGAQASFHSRRDGSDQSSKRVQTPAAVTFDFASNCRIENCRFTHLGGTALSLRQQCFDNVVSHSAFDDIGANGIDIGETFTRPWPNDVPTEKRGGSPNLCARGNVLHDCTIERCGQRMYGAVGVWVGIAAETEIAHNLIRHLPYTGVSIGWSWNPRPTGAEKNRVLFNHIHNCMQILSDGGGIYSLGRQPGSRLEGNVIHDIPLNAGRAESNGMFLDEGTTELLVTRNTIYHIDKSPIRYHRAEEVAVSDNTLVSKPGVPTFRYNNSDPALKTYNNNREITASVWQPPKALVQSAGPRSE